MPSPTPPPDGPRGSTEPLLDLRSRIPASAHGRPLLAYLLARFPYQDEAAWRVEIAAGRLWLDGRPASADAVVRGGGALLYRKPHAEPPVDVRVRIVHREPGFAIVEKPPHLPMHADGPFVRHTLIHLLRHDHGMPTATLVHRLDRETSGLVVVALDATTRAGLEQQFRAGHVHKVYVAVVEGQFAGGTCDAAIGHAAHSEVALRRSAAADARDPQPAHTAFTPLAHGPARTLVRCEPHTGRTHQIRVHLEQLGHPITGDRLYGRPDADYLAFVARVKGGADARVATDGGPNRQLLHAAELSFVHPVTGTAIGFRSETPPEFAEWLQRGA